VGEIQLTSAVATAIFVLAVVAGFSYRRVWKAQGPRWQLWLFGLTAAICLMIVGFVPLRVG